MKPHTLGSCVFDVRYSSELLFLGKYSLWLYNPFNGTQFKKGWKNIGFYSNVNLAEVTSAGNVEGIFNKQVEGGLGLSYRLSKSFALATGYEFVFHRRIRDYLFTLEDYQIKQNNIVLTNLDKNDDNLFRDDNAHAWTFKFIYNFGANGF